MRKVEYSFCRIKLELCSYLADFVHLNNEQKPLLFDFYLCIFLDVWKNLENFLQYLKKTNMISINRLEGTASMRKMLKEAKSKMSAGYSIIIFPEGTRKIPGDKPDYKTGFIGIHSPSL